jgi:hypothetical protein
MAPHFPFNQSGFGNDICRCSSGNAPDISGAFFVKAAKLQPYKATGRELNGVDASLGMQTCMGRGASDGELKMVGCRGSDNKDVNPGTVQSIAFSGVQKGEIQSLGPLEPDLFAGCENKIEREIREACFGDSPDSLDEYGYASLVVPAQDGVAGTAKFRAFPNNPNP